MIKKGHSNIHRDWNKRRKIICTNCDKEGHVHRCCNEPITSYGIVAVRKVKNNWIKVGSKNNQEHVLEYFMVQRRCTMGYIDFLRGKYTDKKYLLICFQEMTQNERRDLLEKDFETLWDDLWMNHNSNVYINSFINAKQKFDKLDIAELLSVTVSDWEDTEYGFPKGRKNVNESNIQCAIREFKEESGFKKEDFVLYNNNVTFQEIFKGTNGIMYRHVYYIALINSTTKLPIIDEKNILQSGEVKKFGWFSFEESMGLIRYYDYAKKIVLQNIHNYCLQIYKLEE